MTPVPDYAADRAPQRTSFGDPDPGAYAVRRRCPLRPDDGSRLFPDEIPHALMWLAVRGDTVQLYALRAAS